MIKPAKDWTSIDVKPVEQPRDLKAPVVNLPKEGVEPEGGYQSKPKEKKKALSEMSFAELAADTEKQNEIDYSNKPDNFFDTIGAHTKPLAEGEVQYGIDKGVNYNQIIDHNAVNSKLFAAKETFWGDMAAGTYKGVAKGLLSIPEFAGYLGDLDSIWDANATVDNALSEKMNEYKDYMDSYKTGGAPIHAKSDDPLDFGDKAFWANMLESTVSSAVSFAALGFAAEATIGQTLTKALMLRGMTKVPAERLARVATALVTNKAESTMMAVELKDNITKDLISKGYNPYEANQKGEEAASKFILTNKLSAGLDYLQLGAMFGSKDAIGKVSNLTKAAQYGVGASEEAAQEIFGDALQHGYEKKTTEDKDVLSGMLDFVGSKEAVVSGLGGVFGGLFNTGIGKATEKLTKLYNPKEDPKYQGILTEKRPDDVAHPGEFEAQDPGEFKMKTWEDFKGDYKDRDLDNLVPNGTMTIKEQMQMQADAANEMILKSDEYKAYQASKDEYLKTKEDYDARLKEHDDTKTLQSEWDKTQAEYNKKLEEYESQEGKLSENDIDRRLAESAVRYINLKEKVKNNQFNPRMLQKTFEGELLDLVSRAYERQDVDTLVAKLEAYSDATVNDKPAADPEFKAAVNKLLPKIKKDGEIYNTYNSNVRKYGKQAANDLLSIEHEKSWANDEYKHASNELEKVKGESVSYTSKDPVEAQNLELEQELKALDIAINKIEKHYEEIGLPNDDLTRELVNQKKTINSQLYGQYKLTYEEAKILAENGEVKQANEKAKEAADKYNQLSQEVRQAIDNKVNAKVAAITAEHYETLYKDPKTFERKAEKALNYVKGLANNIKTKQDINDVYRKIVELSQVVSSKKHINEVKELTKQLFEKKQELIDKEQQLKDEGLTKISLQNKVDDVNSLLKSEELIDDLVDTEEVNNIKTPLIYKRIAVLKDQISKVERRIENGEKLDSYLESLKEEYDSLKSYDKTPIVSKLPEPTKTEKQERKDIILNSFDKDDVYLAKQRAKLEKKVKTLSDDELNNEIVKAKDNLTKSEKELEHLKLLTKKNVSEIDNVSMIVDNNKAIIDVLEKEKQKREKENSDKNVIILTENAEQLKNLEDVESDIPAIAQVVTPLVISDPIIANKIENSILEISDIKLNDTDNEQVLEVIAADNILKATEDNVDTSTALVAGPTPDMYNPNNVEEYTESMNDDWLLNSNLESYSWELKSLINSPETFKQGVKVSIDVNIDTLQKEWEGLPGRQIKEAPNATRLKLAKSTKSREERIDIFHTISNSFYNKPEGQKIKSLPFLIETNDPSISSSLSEQLSLAVSQINSVGTNAHRMGLAVLWNVIVEQKPLSLTVVSKSPGVLNWQTDTINNPRDVFGDIRLYIQTEAEYANDGISKDDFTENKGIKGIVYGKTKNARGDDYMVALNVGKIGEETASIIFNLVNLKVDNDVILDESHNVGITGVTKQQALNILIHNGSRTGENNYKYPFYFDNKQLRVVGGKVLSTKNKAEFIKVISQYPNPVELSFLNKSLPDEFTYNGQVYTSYNDFLYDTGRVSTTVSNDPGPDGKGYPKFYNSRVKLSSPDITAMNIAISERKAKINQSEPVYGEIAKMIKSGSITMTEKQHCK